MLYQRNSFVTLIIAFFLKILIRYCDNSRLIQILKLFL